MRVATNLIMNTNLPIQHQINILQEQINRIFTVFQGRVSFGTGVDGVSGQNIEGEWHTYTSNAVANTEDTLGHTIGAVPLGYIVVYQDKAGSLYQGPATGTAWTSSNIYLKCSVASVAFLLFLVKKGSVTS